MKHLHHLRPKHRGGTDADGLVEVTLNQHIMFHFCEWKLWGHIEDKLAYKGLSGKDEEREEILREMSRNRFWVTNGTDSKLLNGGEDIPEGWYRGRVMSPQSKNRMSKSGRGRKQSETHKTNKALSLRKYYDDKGVWFMVYPPEGDPYPFQGKRKFCRMMGWDDYKEIRITEVLKGRKKSYKGFVFRPLDNK